MSHDNGPAVEEMKALGAVTLEELARSQASIDTMVFLLADINSVLREAFGLDLQSPHLGLYSELEEILGDSKNPDGFRGQIRINCKHGQVVDYEVVARRKVAKSSRSLDTDRGSHLAAM